MKIKHFYMLKDVAKGSKKWKRKYKNFKGRKKAARNHFLYILLLLLLFIGNSIVK